MKTGYPAGRCAQALRNWRKTLVRGLLTLVLLQNNPAALCAYDFPLSETAVRDAYFMGIRQGNLTGDFLKHYARNFPGLKVEQFISFVRLEPPSTRLWTTPVEPLPTARRMREKTSGINPWRFACIWKFAACRTLRRTPSKLESFRTRKRLLPMRQSDRHIFRPRTPTTACRALGSTLTPNLARINLTLPR